MSLGGNVFGNAGALSPPVVDAPNLASSIREPRNALARATDYLVSMQNQSGFWCAELEGDSIPWQSEYILLKFIIEQEDDPASRKSRITSGCSSANPTVPGYSIREESPN